MNRDLFAVAGGIQDVDCGLKVHVGLQSGQSTFDLTGASRPGIYRTSGHLLVCHFSVESQSEKFSR